MTAHDLLEIPLFADLSPDQVALVLERAAVVTHRAGDVIHDGEEPSAFFWVLLSGAWRNERRARGSLEPIIVERDKPGTWFGGIAFVDVVAPMTARAIKDSRFVRVSSTDMLELARANPALARHLMSGVRWGMTAFLEHLDSQKQNTVPHANFPSRENAC
jgi:CRP-like cAMP-binding protein